MVLKKDNAIAENRAIMGATNPLELIQAQLEKNLEYQLIKLDTWI